MKVQIYFNSKFVELIIKSIMFELRFVTLRELELLQGFKKVKWPKEAEPVPERQHGGQCDEFASPEGSHGRCSSGSWYGEVRCFSFQA